VANNAKRKASGRDGAQRLRASEALQYAFRIADGVSRSKADRRSSKGEARAAKQKMKLKKRLNFAKSKFHYRKVFYPPRVIAHTTLDPLAGLAEAL
jgi:hypothetical protein